MKELKEFGVDIYGYDPLLSKEEIEAFEVKALDFSFSTGFLFSKKKKCVDVDVYGYDPLLSREQIEDFGVKTLDDFNMKVDCVIVTVAHDEFKKMKLDDVKGIMSNKPLIIDERSTFNGEEAKENGFYYRKL